MRKDQLLKALARSASPASASSVRAKHAAQPVASRRRSGAGVSVQRGKSSSRPAVVSRKAGALKTAARKAAPIKSAVVKGAAMKAVSRKPVKAVVAKPAAVKPTLEKSNLHKLIPQKPLAVERAIVPAKSIMAKPIVTKPILAKTNGHLPLVSAQKPAATNGQKLVKPKEPAPKESAIAKRLQRVKAKIEQLKDLAPHGPQDHAGGPAKDRLVVMVRDSYWLHAYWELSRHAVERAKAALAQEWHATKPMLRVFEVSSSGTTNAAETLVRDIEIHGGVNNWYIDVQDPPKIYRLDIGYRGPSGKFFVLARSNIVCTPKPGAKDALDENWTDVAQNYDKIYAMSGGYSPDGTPGELQELFEERLRRPMGSPMISHLGSGVEGLLPKRKDFTFDLDAELIVYGVTEPDAHVTLQGDPVRLRPDGSFTVRFSLPNCRQVIPAVASSANGLEQRTIVLAVERNTKVMEPLLRDAND
jgi:hypothetical protein